ncbi:threonine-phosphate decarboxylase CobD [Chelatococcus sp. GCM10030263]|uniref:threonine-phosphate decarboxylase CobD n=1 Tax=Chelatococcus sp. GCM10030263 TaxID=3273387 RepID=UPI00360935B1
MAQGDITRTARLVSPVLHGGDLDAARAAFPGAPEPWLDLSTGINPVPYPLPPLPDAAWARLPGREALASLEETARIAYAAAPEVCVVAAPGSQALIQLLPRLVTPARVSVLHPTYGEHAPAWAAAGHSVVEVSDPAACAEADVVVITQPNNPDGRVLPPDVLMDLERRAAEAVRVGRDGLLVIDEAFADVMPGASHVGRLASAGRAVVLRSFGKFFGLAGIRLGFALTADTELAGRLRALLGPWAVSGPAIAVGTAALADLAWQAATRMKLEQAAARLDALFTGAGFAVRGGTPLFRLMESEAASGWYDVLGRRGILVRRFPDQPTRLRIGLPGGEPEWARLADALSSCAPTVR